MIWIELKMARTVLDDTDQVDRNDEVARLAALDLLIKSKGSYKSQVTMALNALQIKLNTLDSQKKAGLVHRDNLKDTEVNVANVESKKENWIKLLLRVAELSDNNTEKAKYTEAAEKANSDTLKNIQNLFYLSYTDLHRNQTYWFLMHLKALVWFSLPCKEKQTLKKCCESSETKDIP